MPIEHSIVQATLPSIAEMRARRDQLSERELWQRCQSAARLEMRGSRYSSDDRQDCAAQIMADGIAALNGSMPTNHDPKHSLAAYCGRAKNIRRSVDRMRDRDLAALESEQNANAWSIGALTPDDIPSAETDPSEALKMAEDACRRLKIADSGPILTLIYGYARDLPSAVVADELEMSPNAYDVACCRGRALVREQYPTAEDFLTALCGDPVWSIDPMTGEPMLTFSVTDASKSAHDRTHAMAQDWRSGTDGGSWPERPESAEQARAACEIRHRPAAPKTAEQNRSKAHRKISPMQAEADALRNLGLALSR
jgi:hypothetical protein